MPDPSLPPPAWYFPPAEGRYDVSPGLSRLGRNFGNGPADAAAFQVDADFPAYRAAKLAARRAHPGRHVVSHDLDDRVAARVARFVAERLAAEHPALFGVAATAGGSLTLGSSLTGEALTIDDRGRLPAASGSAAVDPPYAGALDAVAAQVQEDLAVVAVGRDGRPRLAAAHVCFPNGWAPEAMAGRDFAGLHAAVPGMGAMNARGDDFARLMVGATTGLVRFAWGLAFDDHLNHHPARPRPAFDPARPAAWLRVERQTIHGFPDVAAALFTIRTYLYSCADACRAPATRDRLVAAVASMSAASLAYKGLDGCRDVLLRWLASLGRPTPPV